MAGSDYRPRDMDGPDLAARPQFQRADFSPHAPPGVAGSCPLAFAVNERAARTTNTLWPREIGRAVFTTAQGELF